MGGISQRIGCRDFSDWHASGDCCRYWRHLSPGTAGHTGCHNAAMVGGSESVAEYNKQIQNGVPVPLAADRAALSFAQNAGLGFAEGMTDYLFLGLGKLGRGTRAVKALEPLRKITERLPKYARVGAAAGRGALTEGLQEGVQGVLQEEISRAADRDALGSPLAAADRLFNNEGTQRIFWENFAIGALLGGAFGGGIELATSSVPVTTEFLGKIGEEGSVNDEVLGELQELNEQERGDAVAVATYRAAAEKNADLPDAAVYAGLTRTGKRGIDDVIGKILKRVEFVEDAELGNIALPTNAEVAAQFVDMDLVGRTMEQVEGYRAARQEQERVADEQLRARPQEVLRVADGRVETRPGVDGRFSLADFNLQRIRGKEITQPEVRAAQTQGFEGVYTDTGESLIFDDARVRRVLGDNAVREVQEQHRAQFREKIFEKVPSLREAEVAFVDGLVNGVGLGAYFEGEGRIEISKDNERWNTLAHEASHHYFDTGLDTAGQNRVVRAIQAEYGQEVQEMVDKHFISQKEAVKEVFAEKFGDWAAQDAAPKTFLERVWAKLRDILRDIVESPELRRVYREFARGEGRLEMARADAVADGMGERRIVERMREAFYQRGLRLPLYQRGDEGEGIILNVADYLHNRDFQKRFDVPLTDEEQKVVQSVRKRYVAAFERERGTGLAKNEEMKRYDQAASQAAQRLLGFTDGNVPRAVALAFRLDELPGGFEENEIIGQKVIDMSGTLKWRNEPLYQRGNVGGEILKKPDGKELELYHLRNFEGEGPHSFDREHFGEGSAVVAMGGPTPVSAFFFSEEPFKDGDNLRAKIQSENALYLDMKQAEISTDNIQELLEEFGGGEETVNMHEEEGADRSQYSEELQAFYDLVEKTVQSEDVSLPDMSKIDTVVLLNSPEYGTEVMTFDERRIVNAETGEANVFYQRGEDGSAELMGQVAKRVEARDGVVPSAAMVRKELLKGLLAYRAVKPVQMGGVSYYPVYINVGDGKFEKGMSRGTMMAGWFSIKDGAVTGVGVRKWAEGAGRGDVRFDSQDPVMYEKVGDVLMEHLDAEGMTVVEWQATGKVADKIGEYLRVQKGGPVLHTNKRWDEILEMIDAKKSNWKLPRRDDTLYQRDDSSWNDLLNALGAGSSKFELRKEVDKIRKREEKFGDMQTRFPSGTHAIGDVAESWTKAVNGIAEGAVSGYVVAVDRRSDGDQYWIVDEGIANKEQASEIAEKIDEIGDVSIAERIDLIRKIANDVAVEGAFDKWAVMTVRTPMEKPLYQRGVLEVQRDWAVMPLDEGDVGDDAPLYQRAKLGAKQAQWVKEAGLTEAKDLTQNEQAQVALTGQEVAAPSKSKGLGIAVRGVVRRVPDVLRKFGG